MLDYTVVEVSEWFASGGVECWRVTYAKPDGQHHDHVFPKMTLDARAAEYGIDPADTGLLLDVVLHEPFMADPTDPDARAEDPGWKAGHRVPALENRGTVRRGQPVPAWLFNSETIDQAREAHLVRVAHVKATRMRIVTPHGAKAVPDPLDRIRNEHQPDHALIEEIAQTVGQERRRLKGERTTSDRGGAPPPRDPRKAISP